jgi:hypothetical protein
MKRFLLLAFFAITVNFLQAQLEEDFNPTPTGWILANGAGFSNLNSNAIVLTPGAGSNDPSMIGTPAVNRTSNTVKVCLDIWAYTPNLNQQIAFPCTTYMDVLFVKSSVTDTKDAEKAANIFARVDNYQLAPSGGNTCVTFTFPDGVTDANFKVFLSFHGDCGTGGYKYVIDNVKISGVDEVCSGNSCPPTALDDAFNRIIPAETSFTAVLYGKNTTSSFPAVPSNYAVDTTGTDNDQNDDFTHLTWSIITQPVNGSVVVNADKSVTISRLSTSVTSLTFTYSLCDDGADNIAGNSDDLCDSATVLVSWPAASTLPVSLINFSANRSGTNVTLQWTTTFESNNAGFKIQRSTGNSAWETAGYVATKAQDGNSSTPITYQYKETNTAAGFTWYRLVQIDKDNTPAISVSRGVRGLDESARISVYPNPGTTNNMNVLFGSSASRDIAIADLNGKIVRNWNNYHNDNLSISGLNAGVYMLLVTNKSTNERQTHKIVIVK